MACIFFADKDADDFTRKRLRSEHLVYSLTYDLEGYLFSCGDLHRAMADTCGITLAQSRSLIPNPASWLAGTVSLWKEWIALCLVSQVKRANCGCTFDCISRVNPDPLAPPDSAQVSDYRTRMATALSISQQALDFEVNAALRRVEASIQKGTPPQYFKGKWLNHIIQRHLEAQPRIPDAMISGAGERIGVSLVGQVAHSPACICCAVYSRPVLAILDQLR